MVGDKVAEFMGGNSDKDKDKDEDKDKGGFGLDNVLSSVTGKKDDDEGGQGGGDMVGDKVAEFMGGNSDKDKDKDEDKDKGGFGLDNVLSSVTGKKDDDEGGQGGGIGGFLENLIK
ncbi:hypothetical protein JOB18_017265 [Solea senegalensis]|uniref:Uncharacterized protein n=1 Tax=Solea senegalensis TaxID=28829 RepID=A0AAV6S5B2_SOLSE|nr:hypothetical protein JOB18_017265 [Solea senegalensis]